jgi:hypothetical protein
MKLGLGLLPREIGSEKGVEVARRLLKTINVSAVQKWADETYFVNGKTFKSGWPGGGGRQVSTLLPNPQAVEQFKDGLAAFANTVSR